MTWMSSLRSAHSTAARISRGVSSLIAFNRSGRFNSRRATRGEAASADIFRVEKSGMVGPPVVLFTVNVDCSGRGDTVNLDCWRLTMASKRRADRDGAAMRQKLLDAAVECLIELGVAGTTTLAVQRRAGTSRGALLHHFPTHADLLAASVAELVKQNERAVATSRAGISGPTDPLRTAVNALA